MLPFGLQPLHLIIILVVALLIFGPKRLPELGRYIGKTLTEFRAGTQELSETFREEVSKPIPPHVAASQTSSADAGNFCTKCGVPNSPQARFCGNCGTPLAEAEKATGKDTEKTTS